MLSDLKFALRHLAKSRGFTVVALLTLALGTGVNTSMFTVLRALLSHPLAYTDGDRLVRVYRTSPRSNRAPLSAPNIRDLQEQNSVFERLAIVQWSGFALTEPGQPAAWVRGMTTTADFFPLMGVKPALGRVFNTEETQLGKNHVLVLSHGFWAGHFAHDPAIVGRQLQLDGETFTVIGVMPPGFDDHLVWGTLDAWRPLVVSDSQRANRGDHSLYAIGRLKSDLSLGAARSALDAAAAGLAAAYPEANAGSGLRFTPLFEILGGAEGRSTVLITGLAGFVLLIACANLANLQFARNAARRHEHAIRAALGASRPRLMRQALLESLLLALGGGALGLLVALWSNDILSARYVINEDTGLALSLDLHALGFALAISTLSGIAFGVLPAWFSSQTDLTGGLKQSGRGPMARTPHLMRNALIVGQIALALVLLASGAFWIGGLKRFEQRNPGWRMDGLLTGYVTLTPPATANTPELRAAYRRTLAERLEARVATIPGVEQTAFGRSLPTWGDYAGTSRFIVEGRPLPVPGAEPLAIAPSVMPGYFEVLGLRLLQGRGLTPADRVDSPPVVVINKSMARTLWPGESPLGKRIGDLDPAHPNWREVVGVVSDTQPTAIVEAPAGRFQMYRPWAQAPLSGGTLIIRTSLVPESLLPELRRAVTEIDHDLPLRDAGTVRHEVDLVLSNLHLAGGMLAAFAGLGLLLAALGIYGVMANHVTQRTHEIGIRMALGAQVCDVLRLVLGQGLKLTLLGATLGLAGAYAASRLLASIMPGLPAENALTVFAVTALLMTVALLACWLPARRAAKVDPMVALRAE